MRAHSGSASGQKNFPLSNAVLMGSIIDGLLRLEIYKHTKNLDLTEISPNIIILKFEAPIHFANAKRFLQKIDEIVSQKPRNAISTINNEVKIHIIISSKIILAHNTKI